MPAEHQRGARDASLEHTDDIRTAGFDRVKVTQTKLSIVRAQNALSSQRTISGNRLIGSPVDSDAQNVCEDK